MTDRDNKNGNKPPNGIEESQKSNDTTLPKQKERIRIIGVLQDSVKPEERIRIIEVLEDSVDNGGFINKEHQSLIIKDMEQDIKLKNLIVRWVIGVVSIYLVVVAGLIIYALLRYQLDTTVLVTLLTTTTLSMLGLPMVIIHHYFRKKK